MTSPGYTPSYGYPSADYGQMGVQTQSAYTPSSTAAQIIVRLPTPDAQLWADDYQVNQQGQVRQLNTPATLEAGKTYHYTLKAQWMQNGQPVTQERRVDFTAGQSTTVDFSQPAATTTAPPAATTPATPLPSGTPPAEPISPPATTPAPTNPAPTNPAPPAPPAP